ncbi:hypothetical protein [Phaeobacter italicus]|uniref:hypothetical protein n=1 Tax=Phaeobacter italicus TaxID=481446 RepID=UPI0021BD1B57|nr:hypothetical protein [Phaeobacter italicus]
MQHASPDIANHRPGAAAKPCGGVLAAVVLVTSLTCGVAQADVKTPDGRTIDCYCTDSSGSRIELGEFICLQVDGRMFTAQCQMSLNVPMWREVQNGCLSAEGADAASDLPHTTSSTAWPRI